jgi:hypothetical protein
MPKKITPKSFIVKVQSPVGGSGEAVLFDKKKSFVLQVPFDQDIRELMGSDLFAFFKASRIGEKIRLGGRVENQGW